VLTSLQALLRLAVLRRLGVFICALAPLLAVVNTASALEPAQTKTRVWGFDLAADNSAGLFQAASSGKHRGNCAARAEEASGSLLAARGAVAAERAIVPFYPAANGFLGATSQTVLKQGQIIDRVGGSAISRFFSPAGTPLAARALPPGTAGPLQAFEVLKPFTVEAGTVAPAFGQLGMGTQFRSATTLGELIEQGFLRAVP
jgi:hypothetical protein